MNCIDYLGHVNPLDPLEVSTRTIVVIRGLEYLTAVTELRPFQAHVTSSIELCQIALRLPLR